MFLMKAGKNNTLLSGKQVKAGAAVGSAIKSSQASLTARGSSDAARLLVILLLWKAWGDGSEQAGRGSKCFFGRTTEENNRVIGKGVYSPRWAAEYTGRQILREHSVEILILSKISCKEE